MIIGHYGVGFAAKRLAPGVPLLVLVTASLLPDILWFIFLAFGLEQGTEANGAALSAAAVVGGPFSHSLITSAAWAALAGGAYLYFRSDRRGALVVALCAASHWLLDALSHNRDLLLYPGGNTLVGLSLSQHPALAAGAEIILFAAGVWLYTVGTQEVTGARDYGFWTFVAFLSLAYASYFVMPQSYSRQVVWPVFLLMISPAVYLFDRHRVRKEPRPKLDPTPGVFEGGSRRPTPPPPPLAPPAREGQIREPVVKPRAGAPGGLSITPIIVAGGAVLLLIPLVAGLLFTFLGQRPAPRPGPVPPQPPEEERRVAEAVKKKVEQCSRVSPERADACRKALENYKADPVLRRLLTENYEEKHVGGWTTVVVTNWERNNFADVFTPPAELGLVPVERSNSLWGLQDAGDIRIDKVTVRWNAKRNLFLVNLTVTNLKGPKITVTIPKGQIIELKWDRMLVGVTPVGSVPAEPRKPKQNSLAPTDYTYSIEEDDTSNPSPRTSELMAVCLNEGFPRPGALASGEEVEEEANISMFKLNVEAFQKERFKPEDYKKHPIDLQRRVHEIIREYYGRTQRVSLPAVRPAGAARGRAVLAASARTPPPSRPARRL